MTIMLRGIKEAPVFAGEGKKQGLDFIYYYILFFILSALTVLQQPD